MGSASGDQAQEGAVWLHITMHVYAYVHICKQRGRGVHTHCTYKKHTHTVYTYACMHTCIFVYVSAYILAKYIHIYMYTYKYVKRGLPINKQT